MPWYYRVRSAINAAAPFFASPQQTNLALLVSAILKKRTLCLSELARAYPTPKERRVASPKHDLFHRPKRLWRFTNNERVDALAVQLALVPHTIACLGSPVSRFEKQFQRRPADGKTQPPGSGSHEGDHRSRKGRTGY